jgi:hypothetical protein
MSPAMPPLKHMASLALFIREPEAGSSAGPGTGFVLGRKPRRSLLLLISKRAVSMLACNFANITFRLPGRLLYIERIMLISRSIVLWVFRCYGLDTRLRFLGRIGHLYFLSAYEVCQLVCALKTRYGRRLLAKRIRAFVKSLLLASENVG